MSNDRLFETNEYLDNADDVIAFSSNSMCKTSQFREAFYDFLSRKLSQQLLDHFESRGIKNLYADWLKKGIECDLLNVGSNGWKKGKIKVKITLEFVPDEPEIKQMESPLDDIRQTMNQSN